MPITGGEKRRWQEPESTELPDFAKLTIEEKGERLIGVLLLADALPIRQKQTLNFPPLNKIDKGSVKLISHE